MVFTEAEQQRLVEAIRHAEKRTSGEIKVHIDDVLTMPIHERVLQLFDKFELNKTRLRNGVLIYLSHKNRQFAIYGDEGIHAKVGGEFWQDIHHETVGFFKKGDYTEGLEHCIKAVGESLVSYFPFESNDTNELPDDITFN